MCIRDSTHTLSLSLSLSHTHTHTHTLSLSLVSDYAPAAVVSAPWLLRLSPRYRLACPNNGILVLKLHVTTKSRLKQGCSPFQSRWLVLSLAPSCLSSSCFSSSICYNHDLTELGPRFRVNRGKERRGEKRLQSEIFASFCCWFVVVLLLLLFCLFVGHFTSVAFSRQYGFVNWTEGLRFVSLD